MAKGQKTKFVCKSCGYETFKFAGVCFGCKEYGTLEEETYFTGKAAVGAKTIVQSGNNKPRFLSDVTEAKFNGFGSGIGELDRVLGGKVVDGSLVLIGGEPGKGKSTILTALSYLVAMKYKEKVIYFSGEESEHQIKLRAERMKLNLDGIPFMVLHTKDIDTIERVVDEEQPKLIIVDSIQTIGDANITSEPGSVSQVKMTTARLMNIAKAKGITTFVVAQVNKDASIAGPKNLEHMVDTVLYLEGDKYNDLRLLRAQKNRFGDTKELGVFQMEQNGLTEVTNPSEHLLQNRNTGASGSVVVCISDARPILIEIQALVAPLAIEGVMPRRTSVGFDRNRLSTIVAVIEKVLDKSYKIALSYKDVYVNVVGGMTIEEPGADLGVAMAIYSSEKEQAIDSRTLIIGEIGLTGEVRPVANVDQLVNEAEKVGFLHCVLSQRDYERVKEKTNSIQLHPVKTVQDAISFLFTSKPKTEKHR